MKDISYIKKLMYHLIIILDEYYNIIVYIIN